MSEIGFEANIEVTDGILEMAKELGYALQEDKRYLDFVKTKEINDSDEELQKLIGDFSIARSKLNAESLNEDRDDDKLEKYDKIVTDIYQNIMSNKNMQDYSKAKENLDEVVRIVSSVIELSANGTDPAAALNIGCSPADCAGCSGC